MSKDKVIKILGILKNILLIALLIFLVYKVVNFIAKEDEANSEIIEGIEQCQSTIDEISADKCREESVVDSFCRIRDSIVIVKVEEVNKVQTLSCDSLGVLLNQLIDDYEKTIN